MEIYKLKDEVPERRKRGVDESRGVGGTLYCTVAGAEVKGNRKKHHEEMQLKKDLGLK